jgi:hypothetical protein
MTYTWRDVPDPRDETCPGGPKCEVLLEDHRWSHIHDHASDRNEPWDDWLTPALADDLRNSFQPSVTGPQRQATRDQVSGLMERAAKQSTGVPLAVLYDVAQPPQPGKHSPFLLTIDLVLPCGAKLCIRQHKGKRLVVLTCFFISAVRSAPKDRRWRLLVWQLLKRYARDNRDGTFSPPERDAWPRRNEETGEYVNDPRFRTDATWGADGKRIDPWDRLPDYWGPPAPPSAPAAPLAPRRTY